MFEAFSSATAQNIEFLTAVVSFTSGVCLLYLVMWRTIKKRRAERDAAEGAA